jgi:hypothetical protein
MRIKRIGGSGLLPLRGLLMYRPTVTTVTTWPPPRGDALEAVLPIGNKSAPETVSPPLSVTASTWSSCGAELLLPMLPIKSDPNPLTHARQGPLQHRQCPPTPKKESTKERNMFPSSPPLPSTRSYMYYMGACKEPPSSCNTCNKGGCEDISQQYMPCTCPVHALYMYYMSYARKRNSIHVQERGVTR